jgi:sugar-phosphatase
MLEGISLRDCFKVIVAAEDVAVGKPDPSGYLMTSRLLSDAAKVAPPLEPKDCLIVEDAPTVIRTTRKVGFNVLGVATSYPLEKLNDANYAVKSLRIADVKAAIPDLELGVVG